MEFNYYKENPLFMSEKNHICPKHRMCTAHPECYLKQLNAVWNEKPYALDLCKECNQWAMHSSTITVQSLKGRYCAKCCHSCQRCGKLNLCRWKDITILCYSCNCKITIVNHHSVNRFLQ